MTKITFETDNSDNSRMVSLDDILDLIIGRESENQEKSYFGFIKTNDSNILTKIKEYTMDMKEKDFSGLDKLQIEHLIEEASTDLKDAVTAANFDYLRGGMKLGVRLLFDLRFCIISVCMVPIR